MKDVIVDGKHIVRDNKIAQVIGCVDDFTARILVTFTNGYHLSIIRGIGGYGSHAGLFEIAPFDKDGRMDGKLLGFKYDHVKGWLTTEEVRNYIEIMGNLA